MALAATMSPENSLADQSCTGRNEIMTLRFAEIQQELKVAAAECRAAYDYKRFVHAYKPALDLSDQAMLSVFRDNSVGDTGISAYAAFKAQLVSNSLLRSARNKAAFCAEARSEFSAAFSGEGSLETLISSSQPYVDIPFRDCAQNPQPPSSSTVIAQQAAPPAVTRQPVQVASANVAQVPVTPPAIRPDPWAEVAPVAPPLGASDLVRVVPYQAPLVPAIPQLSRPVAAGVAAPQFDVAPPPTPPVVLARVVPHDAPFVPSVPAMTDPGLQSAAAPRFTIAEEAPLVAIARVVPHHARFVPGVPAMTAPAPRAAEAPRFAIARDTQPVAIARVEELFVVRPVVPRRSALRPAGLVFSHPRAATMEAPEVEIARTAPTAAPAPMRREAFDPPVARGIPRRSALRPAELVLSHPRAATMEAPEVEVARAAPTPAPAAVPSSASESAIARSLARLSFVAAAMLKRDAAADAAEPPAHARPMVAAPDPASRPADTQAGPASQGELAVAAAQAADMLRNEPDAHPERRIAARQPLNQGTTHRRLVAANLIVPAKRGVPLSALNPTIEVARVDQIAALPPHTARASDPVPAKPVTADQSAVVVAGRADVPASKLAHGFSSAKATTYGRAPKPVVGDANTGETDNSPVGQAAPDAPSAALMPQDQNQDENSIPDQNNDQQSAPNNDQDDQYGPAYAYDDGYARARARARAWRRHIIDALETYRRRSVPEDYSGDYPPPPPWRNDSSDDYWSNR
jgi:hypothetical protein